MQREVTLSLDEVERVYYLIHEMQRFFHQPMNYDQVGTFAEKQYPEIRDVYYNVIWNWLPEDVQQRIMEE